MSDFNYIRTHYGVPAELGRIVEMNGRRGVIVKDCGNHVGVNFDDDKTHVVSRCHPTWEMQYLGIGLIRETKLTRAQKRYQEWKHSEADVPFAEWLGVDTETMLWKRTMRQLGHRP